MKKDTKNINPKQYKTNGTRLVPSPLVKGGRPGYHALNGGKKFGISESKWSKSLLMLEVTTTSTQQWPQLVSLNYSVEVFRAGRWKRLKGAEFCGLFGLWHHTWNITATLMMIVTFLLFIRIPLNVLGLEYEVSSPSLYLYTSNSRL